MFVAIYKKIKTKPSHLIERISISSWNCTLPSSSVTSSLMNSFFFWNALEDNMKIWIVLLIFFFYFCFVFPFSCVFEMYWTYRFLIANSWLSKTKTEQKKNVKKINNSNQISKTIKTNFAGGSAPQLCGWRLMRKYCSFREFYVSKINIGRPREFDCWAPFSSSFIHIFFLAFGVGRELRNHNKRNTRVMIWMCWFICHQLYFMIFKRALRTIARTGCCS